jgi:hypothetical protein
MDLPTAVGMEVLGSVLWVPKYEALNVQKLSRDRWALWSDARVLPGLVYLYVYSAHVDVRVAALWILNIEGGVTKASIGVCCAVLHSIRQCDHLHSMDFNEGRVPVHSAGGRR